LNKNIRGRIMSNKKMIEVDEDYFKSIERDSYMLQYLDACGAPSLPVWDEAKAMFDKEHEEELDGYDDAKDVGYDY
jgi:hypothetical protein|tara:strand:+ start:426 stop:653 length:228 start_codon:yes stop_codon:yes gene_type:complete